MSRAMCPIKDHKHRLVRMKTFSPDFLKCPTSNAGYCAVKIEGKKEVHLVPLSDAQMKLLTERHV